MRAMTTALLTLATAVACGAGTDATPDAPPIYAGSCPDLSDGMNTIESSGTERRFLVRLPASPRGAPVIFTWHWLMGEPDQAIDWTGLGGIGAENDVIVVSPFTHPDSGAMWSSSGSPDDNVDVALFDDVLGCLVERHDVDLDRIWVTGHSMGGIFVSYLVLHRANRIAAFAPLSGGLFSAYETPARPLPGLLLWGGPTDECCGVDFHDRTLALSERLRADGSFVVHCEGDFGHQLPPQPDVVWPFLEDHVRGAPSPYDGALPAGRFPSWCSIPD